VKPLLILLLLALSGCSSLGGAAVGLAKDAITGGGGPSLDVETQIGKTNTKQAVGQQKSQTVTAGDNATVTVVDRKEKVTAERVETIVVNERTPPWIWILLVLGWVLPSPNEIANKLRGLIKRNGRMESR
jgi:hypothetical protein